MNRIAILLLIGLVLFADSQLFATEPTFPTEAVIVGSDKASYVIPFEDGTIPAFIVPPSMPGRDAPSGADEFGVMAGFPKVLEVTFEGFEGGFITYMNQDGPTEFRFSGTYHQLFIGEMAGLFGANGEIHSYLMNPATNCPEVNGFPLNPIWSAWGAASFGYVSTNAAVDVCFPTGLANGMADVGGINLFSAAGVVRDGFPVDLDNFCSDAAISDLNIDGLSDIIVQTRDGDWPDRNWIEVIDGAGNALAGFPVALDDPTSMPPMQPGVADLDGDGIPEIVVLCLSTVYVISADGDILDQLDIDADRTSRTNRASPSLADIDGDGFIEIVISTKSTQGQPFGGTLYILQYNSDEDELETDREVIFAQGGDFPALALQAKPTIADLDRDGDLEIVFNGTDGVGNQRRAHPMVLSWDGEDVTADANFFTGGDWTVDIAADIYEPFLVGDIDGDADYEIIAATSSQWVGIVAYHEDGSAVDDFPITEDGFLPKACLLMDGDGDGHGEIVAHGLRYNEGEDIMEMPVYDWESDLNFNVSHTEWRVFGGNAQLSNLYTKELGGTLLGNLAIGGPNVQVQVTSDVTVPDGMTLTIREGTTLSLYPGVKIRVEGTLYAVGDAGDPIVFQPIWKGDPADIPSNQRIVGLDFYGAENCELSYVEIWGATYRGIYSSRVTDFDQFDHVQSHHNSGDGFYIFGSATTGRTTVNIGNCEFDHNGNEGLELYNNDQAYIYNSSFHNNAGIGLKVYNGVYGISNITSINNSSYGLYLNNAYGDPMTDIVANENESYGFYITNDASFFVGAHAENNDGSGVYASTSSEPGFGDSRIANNGTNDRTYNSAEIRLFTTSGWVNIGGQNSDIFDDDILNSPNNPPEYLIYKSVTPNTGLDGTYTWWGRDAAPGWTWFYPSGDPTANPSANLMTAATFNTFDHEANEPDVASPTEEARGLLAEAKSKERDRDYTSAIGLYSRVIEQYSTLQPAFTALKQLQRCWERAGRSMTGLETYLAGFDCPEGAESLQQEIFFALNMVRVEQSDYDQVIGDLTERVEHPQNLIDSLRCLYDRELVYIGKANDGIGDGGTDGAAEEASSHETLAKSYLKMLLATDDQEVRPPTKSIPTAFNLADAYPNPFNATTTIRFDLPVSGAVKIGIYDLGGRQVATLVDGERSPGSYSVVWNAEAASAGVYFYRIDTGTFSRVKSMTLLR